jgi:hypothetical protein
VYVCAQGLSGCCGGKGVTCTRDSNPSSSNNGDCPLACATFLAKWMRYVDGETDPEALLRQVG